jgi:fructokinase
MTNLGGIEAGGTKFVCGAGSGPADLYRIEFPTTSTTETIANAIELFKERAVNTLGVACFGPVDLAKESPSYGHIRATPKLEWRDFDIVGELARALKIPVVFDTDVNGAVLGEVCWGAAQGLSDALYLTVGTGIGGGAIVGGRLLHGLSHPEMGHVRIPHDFTADPFPGCCPSHGDCLEGLASGFAIEKRWGARGQLLPESHPAWELEAHYLALGLMNWVCTLSPKRIILGGGVMCQSDLLPLVRRKLTVLLNGYVQVPDIVAPALGGNAGVLGAIALARMGDSCRDMS